MVEGAVITGPVAPLARGDYVDRNDKDFRPSFPYLALPHAKAVNQGPDRPPRTAEFVPTTPDRVLDTRPTGQTGYSGPKPAAGQVIEVDVTGIGDSLVPDDAKAVTVNLVATGPAAPGWLTAYDCDDPIPYASNVNYKGAASVSTSNMSAVGVSDAGTICIFTSQSTDVVADITGYMPATSVISPALPERLLDARVAAGQIGYTGPRPTAGQTVALDVTDVGDMQVPTGSKGVFVNVTAVDPAAAGWITVYACDAPKPNASALNYYPGDAIPNLVLAPIAADGTICLYTEAGTDIAVDLVAVVPATSEYVAAGPQRILDTRAAAGQVGYTGGKPGAGQVIEVQVSGVGAAAVPTTASAVFLNVTTTNQSPVGWVTVFPCGTQKPNTSNGNFRGSTTANLAATALGDSGRVCVFVSSSTDVVVDLVGYLPGVGIVS